MKPMWRYEGTDMKPMWRKVGASVNHYDVVGIPGCNIGVIRRLDYSGEKRWHVTVTGEGPTIIEKFTMHSDAEKYIDWLEAVAWARLERFDEVWIDFYEKNLELERWHTPVWARPCFLKYSRCLFRNGAD